MKVHRKSDLISYLDQNALRARKSLSQNFLIDRNVIDKIIEAARLETGDVVIEVGPGPGALTELLLEKTTFLTAIEKDEPMASALKERFRTQPLEVISADILEWNVEEWALQHSREKKIKVLSNLPYQITSPFLGRFLPLNKTVSSLTLMVQKEVAERICAKPGSQHYSHLSVLCHLYANPIYCFDVSRNCFYPKPNVTSAVVHLPLQTPRVKDPESFLKFTRLLFQFRRKMIRSILKKNEFEVTNPELESLLNRRAEELSLEELDLLFQGCKNVS